MKRIAQGIGGMTALLLVGVVPAAATDKMTGSGTTGSTHAMPHGADSAPGILPSGLGEAVDRDVQRVRAATARFKSPDQAMAAGYESTTECIENPPHGGMGLHFDNPKLRDGTLEVEKPEVLVYEQLPDGSLKLNGVEYIVPIAAWKRDEPPTIMGQKLKRADKLGFWYLHAWIWEPSPPGLFADWNPRVKCPKPAMK